VNVKYLHGILLDHTTASARLKSCRKVAFLQRQNNCQHVC